MFGFFFCKQKTAYEMRISDWSSDVCSSDLAKTELQKIETEEDRLIRLVVSGRITEPQFDRQRKFITERLETARASVGAAQGRLDALERSADRRSVVLGKSVRVCRILGGRRILTQKQVNNTRQQTYYR